MPRLKPEPPWVHIHILLRPSATAVQLPSPKSYGLIWSPSLAAFYQPSSPQVGKLKLQRTSSIWDSQVLKTPGNTTVYYFAYLHRFYPSMFQLWVSVSHFVCGMNSQLVILRGVSAAPSCSHICFSAFRVAFKWLFLLKSSCWHSWPSLKYEKGKNYCKLMSEQQLNMLGVNFNKNHSNVLYPDPSIHFLLFSTCQYYNMDN